jgi:putative lipase involved disintegration of autophagic bodies
MNCESTYLVHSRSGFVNVLPLGWERVGLRGYAWSTTDLKYVVISFKGTSFSTRGPGQKADIIPTNAMHRQQVLPPINYANVPKDNLLFNCCPGKYSMYPAPVACVLNQKLGTCDGLGCITRGIRNETSYYAQAW